jgi:hypothetical protein
MTTDPRGNSHDQIELSDDDHEHMDGINPYHISGATMTEKTDLQLKTTRKFRRLRWQFKQDAGLQKLTAADRMLIDQCALLALRSRQMRDDVLSGEKVVDNDDIVRSANAAMRAMKVLAERGAQTKGPKRPYGLADIQAALAAGPDEDDES